MWMYPSSPMRGNKDQERHDKEYVLRNASIVMEKQTNLNPSSTKTKELLIPKA